MHPLPTPWTASRIAKARAALDERLRALEHDPEAELAHLIAVVESDAIDSEGLLGRALAALAALERHADGGALTDAAAARLVDAVGGILRAARAESDGNAIAAELLVHRSRLEARAGRVWAAAWTSQMGRQAAKAPSPELEASLALASARCSLRLGHASVALSALSAATAAGAPAEVRLAARIMRTEALRFAGDLEAASEALREARAELGAAQTAGTGAAAFAVLASEISWHDRALELQRDAAVPRFLASVAADEPPLRHLLIAKLWLYALEARAFFNRIAKVESLRRRPTTNKHEWHQLTSLLAAVRSLETAHDEAVALPRRVEAIREALDDRRRLGDVEAELLVLAGGARMLAALEQPALAALAHAEYRGLSLMLSSGLQKDVLRIESAPAPEAPRQTTGTKSRFARVAAIASLASSAGGSAASVRLRRLFASEEERERLRDAELAQLGARLFSSMAGLKGGIMKVGQVLSYAADLPESIAAPLRLLQDSAEAMPAKTSARVFQQEIGQPPEEAFASWSPRPFAIGSVGQVHRATTAAGEDVAVKIQHPGARDQIESDLANLTMMRPLLARFLPSADHRGIAAELKARLSEEADYVLEAARQRRFAAIFAGDSRILVPRVHDALSTARVLTSDLVAGRSFQDFKLQASPAERSAAATTIVRAFTKALLEHRLFNADPHPGNYLFMDDGRVALLDFGCVREFDGVFVAQLARMVLSAIQDDGQGFRRAAIDMRYVSPTSGIDFDELRAMFKQLAAPLASRAPVRVDHAHVRDANRMQMRSPNTKHITPPPESALLIRVAWGLAAVVAELDAELDPDGIVDELKVAAAS